MMLWSWIAAILFVIACFGLMVLIIDNFETAIVILLVLLVLAFVVLGIMTAREYIFLPWFQTWDIGW